MHRYPNTRVGRRLLDKLLVTFSFIRSSLFGTYLMLHNRDLYRVQLEDHVFRTTEPSTPTSNNCTTTSASSDASPWIIVSRHTCVIVFSILTLSIIISAFAESALLISVCTTSSMNLHDRMFSSIVRATTSFFNKNPSGDLIRLFVFNVSFSDREFAFETREDSQSVFERHWNRRRTAIVDIYRYRKSKSF